MASYQDVCDATPSDGEEDDKDDEEQKRNPTVGTDVRGRQCELVK